MAAAEAVAAEAGGTGATSGDASCSELILLLVTLSHSLATE